MAINPAAESLNDLDRHADDARARIATTIDAIQDKLDPRRILGDALDRAQDGSKDLIGKASASLRAHPFAIGAAITAVGLALLTRRQLSNAKVNLGDGTTDYTDYTDYDDDYAPAPHGIVDEDDGDDAKEKPETSPLVSILVGLAAGAALGALLPTSDAERRVLGETGKRLGAAARAAARRAGDELDAAGLSVDSVRARASDATRKARAAARSVVDAARDEFQA